MGIIRIEKCQTYNFVTINTTKGFGKLINRQVELLQKEKLSLSIKNIIPEHIVKIGVIVGLTLEFANAWQCKEFLLSKAQYKDKIFEIRKNMVHERDISS